VRPASIAGIPGGWRCRRFSITVIDSVSAAKASPAAAPKAIPALRRGHRVSASRRRTPGPRPRRSRLLRNAAVRTPPAEAAQARGVADHADNGRERRCEVGGHDDPTAGPATDSVEPLTDRRSTGGLGGRLLTTRDALHIDQERVGVRNRRRRRGDAVGSCAGESRAAPAARTWPTCGTNASASGVAGSPQRRSVAARPRRPYLLRTSERGGRSSWRRSGTATRTPILGVSRRRPLLVPPRSHNSYPVVPVTNPHRQCPRTTRAEGQTATGVPC
jgi:hypothetical protein